LLSGKEKVKLGLYDLELQANNFVKTGKKITGLSKILSNPNYLMACYHKIQLKREAFTPRLNKTIPGGIDKK
jgi:hypothetical protein